MNNLRDWWKWHNSLDTTVEKCPEVVLHAECLADELNTWLPVYVAEMRNKEGKRYSPKDDLQSFNRDFEAHDYRESTISEFS